MTLLKKFTTIFSPPVKGALRWIGVPLNEWYSLRELLANGFEFEAYKNQPGLADLAQIPSLSQTSSQEQAETAA